MKVCGIDEAGRGPLAGPVVAAAVVIPKGLEFPLVNDSKKLTEKQREALYSEIRSINKIQYSIVKISPDEIDQINILRATHLAMKRAVEKINRKPSFLILDGRMTLDLAIPQKSIVKADERVFSCAF